MEEAELEATVVAVVGESTLVAAHWQTRLGMVFIDGGHGREPANADYEAWAPRVAHGGLLAIHDVFEEPSEGGRPPYEVWRRAVDSGHFKPLDRLGWGSLRVLRRTGDWC